MSTTTTNYKLIKPQLSDPANIEAINPNWDTIDEVLFNTYRTDNKPTPDDIDAVPITRKVNNKALSTDITLKANDVGAVPAGCGYGEQMIEITSPAGETYAEYCSKIDSILSEMADRETKQISAVPPYSEDSTFGAGAVILYRGTDDYASLVTIGHSNKYTYGWRMQKRNGVWEPFEWIDPPMNTNVEYRTVERYNGNAVYKKLGSDGVLYWSTDDKTTWKTITAQFGAARIASGSYSGTGNGTSSKVSDFKSTAHKITLPFEPKLLIVGKHGGATGSQGYVHHFIQESVSTISSGTTQYHTGCLSGKVFYAGNSSGDGLDVSGTTYDWVALA